MFYIYSLKKTLRSEPSPSNKLIKDMLDSVGLTDSELRDALIYPLFSCWIRTKKLNSSQYRDVFHTSLKQMTFGLGDPESDFVFLRSFSLLLLAECVTYDQGITPSEFNFLLKQTHQYAYVEKDIRGYVHIKGWAHSTAHWADLVTASVAHRFYDVEQLHLTLSAIEHALIKEWAYTDDETDRLAAPIFGLLDHLGDQERIIATWIETFPSILSQLKSDSNQNLLFYRTRTNMFHFLSALYFDGLDKKEQTLLQKKIRKIISYIRNRS